LADGAGCPGSPVRTAAAVTLTVGLTLTWVMSFTSGCMGAVNVP
jgi:hypothetical protein